MLKWITGILRSKSHLHHKAQAERAVALQAYDQARSARDTRSQHLAELHLKLATNAELAAVVGRSPSAWRGAR